VTTKSASAIKSFSVYDGRKFSGRIQLHGDVFEAFSINNESLGVFASQQAATDVVAATHASNAQSRFSGSSD
jgi:hypothetical protein